MKISHILSALVLLATACTSPNPDKKACTSNDACEVGFICLEGVCTQAQTCEAIAPTCTTNQFCRDEETGARCVDAGCKTSDDCTGDLICLDGACEATTKLPAVDTCEVLNLNRTATAGDVIAIQAAAFDATGRVVPFVDFTVAPGSGAGFSASGKELTVGTGSTTVTVTAQSKTCTASFTGLAANAAGTIRVAVYNAHSGELATDLLAADVYVTAIDDGALLGAFTAGATPGVYTYDFSALAEDFAVTVMATNYYPVTIYGLDDAANDYDLFVPAEPFSVTEDQATGFGGRPDFAAYDAEFPVLATDGDFSVLYTGASIPPSALLSFNLGVFIGDLGTANFSDISAIPAEYQTLPLPNAMYLYAFSKARTPNGEGYAARALPGRRVTWGLGTKAKTSDLLKLISPLLQGGAGINVPAIVASAFPLLDNFALSVDPVAKSAQAAQGIDPARSSGLKNWFRNVAISIWDVFRSKPEAQQDASQFVKVNASPRYRLSHAGNFTNPGTSEPDPAPADDTTQPIAKLNGAGTLFAAVSPAYGIVPLGVGAGVDMDANGEIESLIPDNLAKFPQNRLHGRFSGLTRELADADLVAITAATNFSDLAAKVKRNNAVRAKGIIARSSAKQQGWTGDNLGSFSGSADFAVFSEARADRKYAFDGTPRTFTTPVVSKPANSDLVLVRLTGKLSGAPSAREVRWSVLVNPAVLGGELHLREGGTGKFLGTLDTTDQLVVMTAASLKFNGSGTWDSRLSGAMPIEEQAGDLSSFAIYYETICAANKLDCPAL